jgi:SAM-dependent methyltransferase
MSEKKLNLGCGTDTRDGWINLDSAALPGVDIIHDIESLPLPFKDNEIDEILCQDILEHVEYIPVLKDLHRILAPGGKLHIRVPHFIGKNSVMDPTHRRYFSVSTFDYFAASSRVYAKRSYYFDFYFSSIESRELQFELSSRYFFYNKFVHRFVNKSPQRQEYFESTGLSRLFPPQNILITLVK